jgi:hypothetical protein
MLARPDRCSRPADWRRAASGSATRGACNISARVNQELKLEASRGEGRGQRGRQEEKARGKHEKLEREMLTRREIERTWKLKLLRASANVK